MEFNGKIIILDWRDLCLISEDCEDPGTSLSTVNKLINDFINGVDHPLKKKIYELWSSYPESQDKNSIIAEINELYEKLEQIFFEKNLLASRNQIMRAVDAVAAADCCGVNYRETVEREVIFQFEI